MTSPISIKPRTSFEERREGVAIGFDERLRRENAVVEGESNVGTAVIAVVSSGGDEGGD